MLPFRMQKQPHEHVSNAIVIQIKSYLHHNINLFAHHVKVNMLITLIS